MKTLTLILLLTFPMFADAYAERDGRNARYERIEECYQDGGSESECEPESDVWYSVAFLLLVGWCALREQ